MTDATTAMREKLILAKFLDEGRGIAILFFLELSTRQVEIAGIASTANGLWIGQVEEGDRWGGRHPPGQMLPHS